MRNLRLRYKKTGRYSRQIKCLITTILLVSIFVKSDISFAQPNCQYVTWKNYQNTKLLSHSTQSAYIFTSDHVRIDADGAPNAYHPDDLNLHCTRGEGFKGLDCPANAGYPNSSWWHHVLAPDPEDSTKAYVQPSGAFEGYFVTKTSLTDKSKSTIDPQRYVDATQIPYLVFPRAFYNTDGTGLLGDLGYAVNLSTGESSPFVVADIGPTNAGLGEISINLAHSLGGINPNPRTGAGSPQGEILYIIFPYSSRIHNWPLTAEAIEAKVNDLLATVGGAESAIACNDGI